MNFLEMKYLKSLCYTNGPLGIISIEDVSGKRVGEYSGSDNVIFTHGVNG